MKFLIRNFLEDLFVMLPSTKYIVLYTSKQFFSFLKFFKKNIYHMNRRRWFSLHDNNSRDKFLKKSCIVVNNLITAFIILVIVDIGINRNLFVCIEGMIVWQFLPLYLLLLWAR